MSYPTFPNLRLTFTLLTSLRIQISDALVGMCWSGLVSFLILIVMEATVLLFRHLFSIPEPAFQLILDGDILIDHEIDNTYSFDFIAANALILRMGKERALAAPGNGYHYGNEQQQIVMGGGYGIGGGGIGQAIGELPGIERVVTSGGEETSVIEGIEDDLESEASSQ